MRSNNKTLSHEELLRLVSYDLETGVFTRRVACGNTKKGDEVGCDHGNGYIEASVGGVRFYAHRLAVFYVTGALPGKDVQVDHIDGNQANNAYANLRVVSNSQNVQNLSCKGRAGNKCGHLGVHLHKGSGLWKATVVRPLTKHQICTYHKTKEEAAKAAIELRLKHYPGFTGRDAEQALVNFG
jgi:hypothetical protein